MGILEGNYIGDVNPLGNIEYVSKDENVEWFASDLTSKALGASAIRLFVVANKAVRIECSLDSGAHWFSLNSGDDVVADSAYIWAIAVRFGDLINFRHVGLDDTTILCRVEEIYTES